MKPLPDRLGLPFVQLLTAVKMYPGVSGPGRALLARDVERQSWSLKCILGGAANRRAQKLCESRGGRHGLPVPNKTYGFCRRLPVPNKTYGFSVDVKREERRKRPMNRLTYHALRDTSGEDNRQKRHLIMALVSVVDIGSRPC